jgi:hypothetical protein
VFVHRTSSTSVATWFWHIEGRSVERVILRVRPSSSCLGSHLGSRSLPPLPGRLIGPSISLNHALQFVNVLEKFPTVLCVNPILGVISLNRSSFGN